MSIYYLWDEELRRELNNQGQNYWFSYIEEMLSWLGVRGQALALAELEETCLKSGDVLFTGASALSARALPAIREGLENGMTLIGFRTGQADEIFGIEKSGIEHSQHDDFTFNGYFALREDIKKELLPVPERSPDLPVFSGITAVEASGAEVLAEIDVDNRTVPGLVKYGSVWYFTFDLPKTLWVSAMGKPVYEGVEEFPWAARIVDSRITPCGYDTSIAYGDYFMYILQTVIARLGYPMLHRLPPTPDGEVPDLLLFYGGDEDATESKVTLRAAEIMKERGLPYHINLMPDGEDVSYTLTDEEFDYLTSLGIELSFHYQMNTWEKWAFFSRENFRLQYREYLRRFGTPAVSTVGHCLITKGWAERGRFLSELGVKGDNVRLAELTPPGELNAFNLHGFAFGVTFPFFMREDAEHGNRKLPFVEMQISYYEPRIGGEYLGGEKKIRTCLDRAAFFGRVINLFLHPHYITDNYGYDNGLTLAALDEVERYLAERGYKAIHTTPDKVCLFWHERDASYASVPVYGKNGEVICRVYSSCQDGLIVRFPLLYDDQYPTDVLVDGNHSEAEIKQVDGLKWIMVPVAGVGHHIITLRKERSEE